MKNELKIFIMNPDHKLDTARYLSMIRDFDGRIIYAVHDRKDCRLLKEGVAPSEDYILGDRLRNAPGLFRNEEPREIEDKDEVSSIAKKLMSTEPGYITMGKLVGIDRNTAVKLLECSFPVYANFGSSIMELKTEGNLNESLSAGRELMAREKYLDGLTVRKYFSDSENIGDGIFGMTEIPLPPRYAVYIPLKSGRTDNVSKHDYECVWAAFMPQSLLQEGIYGSKGFSDSLPFRLLNKYNLAESKHNGTKPLGAGTVVALADDIHTEHYLHDGESFAFIGDFLERKGHVPEQKEPSVREAPEAAREYAPPAYAAARRPAFPEKPENEVLDYFNSTAVKRSQVQSCERSQ